MVRRDMIDERERERERVKGRQGISPTLDIYRVD